MEMPHANYHDTKSGKKVGVDGIDFRVELMPIDNKRKADLTKAFISGKGIIGKLKKSDKYYLFTPKGMMPLKYDDKDKDRLLPPDWQQYAVVLTDEMIKEIKLREIIRGIVRENIIDLLKPINENTIGKVSKKIDVTIELDKTAHAGERQTRHGESEEQVITNAQILDVAQRAIEPIHQRIMSDKINVGDKICVKDRKTSLNVVGELIDQQTQLEFKIITVMRKANFNASSGTKVVKI